MSDRYQGSAFRGGGRGPPREDRRYAPRHAYADTRGYDARDSYASSYYPERGYPEARPRKIHRAIPPPRPWDYSRRQPPRNEQERIELEREREAWEAKEEERYRQRMEERERERERDRERGGPVHHGGWDYDAEERMYRGGPPEGYDRERARHADHGPPRRPRSRSPPGMDPRYEQRGSWRRTSIGSAEGRERDDRSAVASHVERAEPSHGYHARRSPPPSAPSAAAGAPPAAAHLDTPDAPRFRPAPGAAADLRDADMRATPRGSAYRPNETGFISTPPTGPRASRGPAMASPAFRREGSGSTGPYTPASERDAFLSPVSSRFPRSARDAPPGSAYRGGHPSFGRGRRDTNPYDHVDDDGYRTHHAGSSPHEASPYSPSTSTQGNAHLTARLSRTSSSQTPTTPAPAVPLPPSSMALLCPELEAELQTIAGQRSAFTSTWMLGAKRTALRAMRAELNVAHLDLMAATSRRQAADRALDAARDSADAYSLEENRKEQLQHLMAQQLQQPPATQTA